MSKDTSALSPLDQLAHELRTPLGTCLAVLEDLLAGYELSPEEIRDGRDAARKMLAILDELRTSK